MPNKSIEVNLLEINGQWPYPEGLIGSKHFIQISEIEKHDRGIIGSGAKAVDGTLISLKSGDTVGVHDRYEDIVAQLESVNASI